MNKEKFRILLENFSKINNAAFALEPTFLDISGFPHYENVCSNILKFFFNSEEQHGLKDLFIQALLISLNERCGHEIKVTDVIREQITNKGNRIDLVILTDDYIIGIENKIYADIYNDLDDYSNYLESIGNGKKVFKVILSISPVQLENQKFTNIVYRDFFGYIDNIVGGYWHKGKDKYIIYLRDFMQTIKSMDGGINVNNELQVFLSENREDAQEFLIAINDMKKELRQRVQNLASRIKYDENKCKQWFWRDNNLIMDDLVHDIYVADAVIAIDTNIYPIGSEIGIWLRKSGKVDLYNKQLLINWLIDKGIDDMDLELNGQDRFVFHKRYSNTDELIDSLQDILDKVCN